MSYSNYFQQYQHRRDDPLRERGQGLVEYALILALVALAVIIVLQVLEPAVANVFSEFVDDVPVGPPALLAYTPPPTDPPRPLPPDTDP